VQIVSCAAGAESAHFCIRGESLMWRQVAVFHGSRRWPRTRFRL